MGLSDRVERLERSGTREPLAIIIKGGIGADPMDSAEGGGMSWQRQQAEGSAAFQARVIAEAKARRARAVVFGGMVG